jgi:hypothetical protein
MFFCLFLKCAGVAKVFLAHDNSIYLFFTRFCCWTNGYVLGQGWTEPIRSAYGKAKAGEIKLFSSTKRVVAFFFH